MSDLARAAAELRDAHREYVEASAAVHMTTNLPRIWPPWIAAKARVDAWKRVEKARAALLDAVLRPVDVTQDTP